MKKINDKLPKNRAENEEKQGEARKNSQKGNQACCTLGRLQHVFLKICIFVYKTKMYTNDFFICKDDILGKI